MKMNKEEKIKQKNIVESLFNQEYTYQEIGEEFKVTKQRTTN